MKPEDEALLSRCQQGDEKAFERLYEKYSPYVYTLAFRFTGHRAESEDLTQEVFLRFFKKVLSFRGESKLSTWLYRITINLCINHRKSAQKGPFMVNRENPEPGQPKEDQRDLDEKIQTTLNQMKEEERLLIILKLMENLSYEEMGSLLDLSEDQIRGRLYRAKQKFREIYQKS